MRELFEEIGPLRDFFLKRPEDKPCFLFVEYGTLEEADKAIANCHGKRVGGKPIFVKYSLPKPKREGQDRPGKGGFGGGGQKGGGDRSSGFGGRGPREEKGDRNWDRGEKSGGFKRNDQQEGGKGGFGRGKDDYQKRDR